jgi:hypothetical protein
MYDAVGEELDLHILLCQCCQRKEEREYGDSQEFSYAHDVFIHNVRMREFLFEFD